MSKRHLSTLTEIAILAALAVVLDRLPLYSMPDGGSVTLAMLPILLIAWRRGFKAGLLTGFSVGLIQLLFGGYFLNLFQVGLDYLLAYATIGAAGLLSLTPKKEQLGKLILGTGLAGLLRLFSHFLSGIIFYGSNAPAGVPVWRYSLVYNASYMLPMTVISMVIIALLYKMRPKFFFL